MTAIKSRDAFRVEKFVVATMAGYGWCKTSGANGILVFQHADRQDAYATVTPGPGIGQYTATSTVAGPGAELLNGAAELRSWAADLAV